jgi:uncharacterized membrane protein
MPHRFLRDPGYYHSGWHGVLGLIFFFAFMALLVLLVVWIVNSLRHGHHLYPAAAPPQVPQEDAALKEARMRYARGELTRKQYLEISADLGAQQPPEATAAPPS